RRLIAHARFPLPSFLERPPRPPTATLFPYTTLFRSWYKASTFGFGGAKVTALAWLDDKSVVAGFSDGDVYMTQDITKFTPTWEKDRKSTRLNSSHLVISYAVFCLKKKKKTTKKVQSG